MIKLKSILVLLLLVALVFSSCKKDDDNSPNNPPDNSGVMVNGSISGIITDQSNSPLSNVQVGMNTNNTITDENGYFSFKNVQISTTGSLVTAQKDGYFYNAKFVSSKENKQNFTKFSLLQKTLSGTFTAASGGTVSTNGGASVDFPASSIKQVGGGAYTGTVNVYAVWLDPTSPDLAQQMPGDLRATNSDNVQQQLTTYGMIGVELEGDAGEALNIADGQTATIELPVPTELAANAPETIPLWHFDEATGFWVEDGEATLQGDKYVGTVSHFSFWNCDVPNDYIHLEGSILARTGIGIQNILVKITENSSGAVGVDYTDQDGVFSGFVPNDQDLTLEVIDNCDQVIFTVDIGPFAEDTSLPPYELNVSAGNTITITGSLVNCNNNPVTNGYFKVDYGAVTLLDLDANGNFSATINTCDLASIVCTGYDLDNLKNSPSTTYDISGLDNLDVGSIEVCDELTEFIDITVDGNNFIYVDPAAEFFNPQFDHFRILSHESDSTQSVVFAFAGATPGTYTSFQSAVSVETANMSYFLFCDSDNPNGVPDCSSFDINVTTFEDIGGFVIGTIEGTMADFSTGISYPISVDFKVQIE